MNENQRSGSPSSDRDYDGLLAMIGNGLQTANQFPVVQKSLPRKRHPAQPLKELRAEEEEEKSFKLNVENPESMDDVNSATAKNFFADSESDYNFAAAAASPEIVTMRSVPSEKQNNSSRKKLLGKRGPPLGLRNSDKLRLRTRNRLVSSEGVGNSVPGGSSHKRLNRRHINGFKRRPPQPVVVQPNRRTTEHYMQGLMNQRMSTGESPEYAEPEAEALNAEELNAAAAGMMSLLPIQRNGVPFHAEQANIDNAVFHNTRRPHVLSIHDRDVIFELFKMLPREEVLRLQGVSRVFYEQKVPLYLREMVEPSAALRQTVDRMLQSVPRSLQEEGIVVRRESPEGDDLREQQNTNEVDMVNGPRDHVNEADDRPLHIATGLDFFPAFQGNWGQLKPLTVAKLEKYWDKLNKLTTVHGDHRMPLLDHSEVTYAEWISGGKIDGEPFIVVARHAGTVKKDSYIGHMRRFKLGEMSTTGRLAPASGAAVAEASSAEMEEEVGANKTGDNDVKGRHLEEEVKDVRMMSESPTSLGSDEPGNGQPDEPKTVATTTTIAQAGGEANKTAEEAMRRKVFLEELDEEQWKKIEEIAGLGPNNKKNNYLNHGARNTNYARREVMRGRDHLNQDSESRKVVKYVPIDNDFEAPEQDPLVKTSVPSLRIRLDSNTRGLAEHDMNQVLPNHANNPNHQQLQPGNMQQPNHQRGLGGGLNRVKSREILRSEDPRRHIDGAFGIVRSLVYVVHERDFFGENMENDLADMSSLAVFNRVERMKPGVRKDVFLYEGSYDRNGRPYGLRRVINHNMQTATYEIRARGDNSIASRRYNLGEQARPLQQTQQQDQFKILGDMSAQKKPN